MKNELFGDMYVNQVKRLSNMECDNSFMVLLMQLVYYNAIQS